MKIINKAKEMERQQIIDAFNEGYFDEKTAEKYYNETFKQ
jgi:predicted secreted protein